MRGRSDLVYEVYSECVPREESQNLKTKKEKSGSLPKRLGDQSKKMF